MRLLAIGDLHLGHAANREALASLSVRSDDWLILAGDVGETLAHLTLALEVATTCFRQVLWVPGNHELWTAGGDGLRGEEKYQALVALCRHFGALTPEDDYPVWTGPGGPCVVAPVFVGYDYSFGPDGATPEQAVAWARESGIVCTDETALRPDPYLSRQDWCDARLSITEPRLEAASRTHPLVIVNHYPLRRELIRLHRIPRFSIWCGTRRTEDWHRRYRARVVVSGHLHIRATDWIDGVRFEEVSLGYPRHWRGEVGLDGYLREILPGPAEIQQRAGPTFHR